MCSNVQLINILLDGCLSNFNPNSETVTPFRLIEAEATSLNNSASGKAELGPEGDQKVCASPIDMSLFVTKLHTYPTHIGFPYKDTTKCICTP